MADDIVTRLKCIYVEGGCGQCTFCLARNEIERLRSLVLTLSDDYSDIDDE